MQFEIEPYEVKTVATRLYFDITGTEGDQAKIQYNLMTSDGASAKSGVILVPLSDVAIITKTPIDLQELNTFLASRGVVITSQIMQSNETEGS